MYLGLPGPIRWHGQEWAWKQLVNLPLGFSFSCGKGDDDTRLQGLSEKIHRGAQPRAWPR